ncbi:MAG: DUF6476 family protein [Hyphomicrobiaceae bacterium]
MADGQKDEVESLQADSADQPPFLSEQQIRKLKISVVVMSALLLVGFAVVIGRIVYLLNQSPKNGTAAPVVATMAGPPIDVALPQGASVRNIALSGNSLAVHFEGPEGPGIAVVDMTSGQVIRRISIRSTGGK